MNKKQISFLITIFLSLISLLIVSCTAPGYNDDYGPEVVLDDTVHTFVDGFNQRDLTQFDSYFAPPDVADPNGLLQTQALAHQLLEAAPPDTTLQLDEWKITNDYPVVDGDPVVSYQAKFSLWQNDKQLWQTEVTQDVSFHFMPDGLWKIVNADPPMIGGKSYEPPPQTVDIPSSWITETTDWYRISYPPDVYRMRDLDASASLITLVPTEDALKLSPDTTFYRVTLAAQSGNTQIDVNAAYDPANLFGKGPILTYGAEEIQDKSIQGISLDGSAAYRIDALDGLGVTTDILALRDRILYEVVVEPYELDKANPNEYLPLVEQIISTFQFTH